MKLSQNILAGVLVTIAGASALKLDLGLAGKSLTDIPTDKRADALLNDVNRWVSRQPLLNESDATLQKRGDSGSASVEDTLGDVVIDVKIGSEKKKVPIIVDIGSPSTIVKDSFYQPNESSSASDPLGAFTVSYLSGEKANGPLILDDFSVGDLTAKSFPIGMLSKKYYSVVLDDKIGGILGLMYPGLAQNKWYKTLPKKADLISNLRDQRVIDNRKWQMTIGDGGKLVIGEHDESLAEGGLKEVVNVGITQNHVGMKGRFNGGVPVVFHFDTGTHGIITTAPNARRIFSEIGAEVEEVDNGSNIVGVVDCKNPPKLKFSDALGFLDVEIPEEDITGNKYHGKCLLPIVGSFKIGVHGALMFEPHGFVLGQSFLRHITFAVDFDKPFRIKVGKRKSN